MTHGLVQAIHSKLVSKQAVIAAGLTYVWQIQAQDLYSNVVTASYDHFAFEIMDLTHKTKVQAKIEYLFGLYQATFALP